MNDHYDVVILGGGLAGLTLTIQLKRANPELSILVLEMRGENAPNSTHKVGESTVELGTHYLREVLDLKDYLDEKQLPKHGLRFFFTPQHKEDISKRVELGPRELLPVPSHQLDRGTFENELVRLCRELGADVLLGAKVKNVDLNETKHTVEYTKGESVVSKTAQWVVDATGRSSFLKRKLGFKKELEATKNKQEYEILYEQLVAQEYEKGKAINAVETLEFDEVIDPVETRKRIATALDCHPQNNTPSRSRFIDSW